MRRIAFPLITLVLFLELACEMPGVRKFDGVKPGEWNENLKVEYSADNEKKSVPLRIYFPRGVKTQKCRTIIALHNYKGSPRDWGVNTEIARFADEYGFIVVCPGMGTTLYETKYYPETQAKWDSIPGGRWIADVLVPYLRKTYGAAKGRAVTGIAGVGMGARGALLIAATYPDMFGAAAGLSGYYDNSVLTENKLFVSLYGKYTDNKLRWEKEDNIITLNENLRETPVFLAHGLKDKEVPVEHSQLLGISLKHLQKSAEGKFRFEYVEKMGMAHDWRFWNSVTQGMMSFFNDQLGKDR